MLSSKFIYGIKANLRIMLSIGMIIIGVLHFINPEPFTQIVPDGLSHPFAWVYGSGLVEILAGAGILYPPTSRVAAWVLIAFYGVVFPTSWYQATHFVASGLPHDPPLLWLRLPLQAILIACVAWLTHDERIRVG
ncbi:MAG: hypothetical protein MUF49_30745 [Oculatellaceae cyanobacterium Prado106]|jgi:uncharacterized membrane protein|nr:hypothetical protein [Oculatellaceae cyanobacterium Prado106]